MAEIARCSGLRDDHNFMIAVSMMVVVKLTNSFRASFGEAEES